MTGHPVKDYVRKRRMNVAASQLRSTDRSVEQLAWGSGFESYHSFAKVFKKIVGLTPAAYRKADIIFSFERIRLHEQIDYMEARSLSERYPDVMVIRFQPGKVYSYLHVAEREAGIEEEAYRIVAGKLDAWNPAGGKSKARIFGYNADLPDEDDRARYGYIIMIVDGEEGLTGAGLTESTFPGGLYAVRKVNASPPQTVQEGWNRLLAEWLPKSTFEIGEPPYIEEFIATNGRIVRMHLYLPVQRKAQLEPIEIVERTETWLYYSRGYGIGAQDEAERRLIDWHERGSAGNRHHGEGNYYMSYYYGCSEQEQFWWENGIVSSRASAAEFDGLDYKRLGPGQYVCCVTKTYGQLTGVLDRLFRWIALSEDYRLDEERQWFAEYITADGSDLERDTQVNIYIPIRKESVHG
jgi:AraC family transcriptional regulator